MIEVTPRLFLDPSEIKYTFIRSPGPGGQNVNKVASGVQLRIDIMHCQSIPDNVRARLLTLLGKRTTQHGELIIKATRYRTQERNKQDALHRLIELIQEAAIVPKKRKKTKPTYASTQSRLDQKKLHAKTKSLRRTKPTQND